MGASELEVPGTWELEVPGTWELTLGCPGGGGGRGQWEIARSQISKCSEACPRTL